MQFTGDETIRCGARVRTCPTDRGGCGYRYTKADRELWACPRCGTDRHCQVPVPKEGDRCRAHNHKGQTVLGFANPSTKHGLASKDLPTRLRAQYEASLADPELLSHRSSIALLEARRAELVSRLDSGGGEENIRKVMQGYKDLSDSRNKVDAAINAGSSERLATSLDELRQRVDDLGATIRAASFDYGIWHDLMDVEEQIRRSKDAERRRLVDMQVMLAPERGLLPIGGLLEILRRRIQDPMPPAKELLASIARDIRETYGT